MKSTDPTRPRAALDPLGLYRCPRNRIALRAGPAGDTLAGLSAIYPVERGVPCFRRGAPEPEHGWVAELVELARQDGWRAAVDRVCDPRGRRYVTHQERGRFLDLLPLRPESVVLEVGASLGQITELLARRVAAVYALEVVPGQAEFAKLRCEGEGLDNVTLAVGGDDCALPYADQGFDVVVLNLVLEWCAGRNPDEPPIAGQRRLLRECARVLRPGGALWIATKNRFALRYVLGKADEHASGLRFGNALPRPLLKALLRARGDAARPTGVLHSHRALVGLLREAGFDRLTSYWATPDVRYPTHYVPTDPEAIRAARRDPSIPQGELRSDRLVMPWVPAPLVKHVTPGLAFLAEK